ncbi:MAG: hypothetical protein JNK64_05840 [Myxococcales bacterium]|nr:hypothetical protein [Myxococcales bacterium]
MALLLGVAPVLALYAPPTSPLLAVVVGTIVIAAALHGLGRGVGALVGDRDAPAALALVWGVAAYMGIAGAAAAAGRFDGATQRLVLGAAIAGGAWWWTTRPRGPARSPWRPSPAWIMPAVAIGVIGLHVLGEAGATRGPCFDGEVFQLGPLARLAATGSLGDAVSSPRSAGLGGGVLVSTLTAPLGAWSAVHAIDRGLALGLAVALAIAALPRGPMRDVVGCSVVALASSLPEVALDLAPIWTVVALVLGIYHSLIRAARAGRTPWSAVLLAGALLAVRGAALPGVVVVVVHAVRAAPVGTRRRVGVGAAAIVAAVVGGLAVDAGVAGAALAAGVRGAPAAWAPWLIGGGALYVVLTLATRDLRNRALDVTIAVASAGVAAAGVLSPSLVLALQWALPLGIALVLLAIAAAFVPDDGVVPRPLAVVALVAVTLVLATLRFPTGPARLSWHGRLVQLIDRAHALAIADDREERGARAAYADALAQVPRRARVGLWVDRADLVDYRRHAVVDLRSAATVACVEPVAAGGATTSTRRACRRLAALVGRLDLDYLIVAPSVPPPAPPWCPPLTRAVCAAPFVPGWTDAPTVFANDALSVRRSRRR